jgi:hypothetical protein
VGALSPGVLVAFRLLFLIAGGVSAFLGMLGRSARGGVVRGTARGARGGARFGAAGVTTMFAGGGSEANGLDYVERTAGRDAIGGEVIPGAELFDGDAEAIGDGDERIVTTHGVALAGGEVAGGGDGDDELVAGLDGAGEVIEGRDLCSVGVQRCGDLVEGLTVLHDMEAPAGAVFFGNIFEAGEEGVAGAGRDVQVVRHVVGGGEAEERGVEGDDLGEGGVGEVGDEAHVDSVVGGEGVRENGSVGNDIGEAVLLRILGHDDGGDGAGDVGLGFGGEAAEAVDLPVVCIAGAADYVLHAAESPIVGGHGEVPVAGLAVEVLHVFRVGDGGLLGIEALVEVSVGMEVVVGAHELPHAGGSGFAIDGLRLEAGFGDGLVDEVLGDTLLAQDALDHVFVFAGALEAADEVGVESGLVGEGADPAGDIVIDDEGEIGVGGLEFGGDLADEDGIGGEGNFVGGVGGRGFEGGGEAVALAKGDHLEAVDGGEEAIELVGELGIAFEVHAGGEHGVDGEVEVLAGGVEAAVVVVSDAGLVAGFGFGDEGLDFLCVLGVDEELGGLLGRGLGGVGGLERGGGGVGGRGAGCCGMAGVGRATGEREEEQDQGAGLGAGRDERESPDERGSFQSHHQPRHCKGWRRWVVL